MGHFVLTDSPKKMGPVYLKKRESFNMDFQKLLVYREESVLFVFGLLDSSAPTISKHQTEDFKITSSA